MQAIAVAYCFVLNQSYWPRSKKLSDGGVDMRCGTKRGPGTLYPPSEAD